jgi:hypothetical protein
VTVIRTRDDVAGEVLRLCRRQPHRRNPIALAPSPAGGTHLSCLYEKPILGGVNRCLIGEMLYRHTGQVPRGDLAHIGVDLLDVMSPEWGILLGATYTARARTLMSDIQSIADDRGHRMEPPMWGELVPQIVALLRGEVAA